METNKIKALLSAVKKGSLSRAADELQYTPSALSHMADSLEEELGIKLLSRTHSGVELTEQGEELKEQLSAVLKAEAELIARARALGERSGCELRIGSYSSISANLLPELLTDFKRQYPNVRVSISVADVLRGRLQSGEADIIFGDEMAFEDNKRFIIAEDPYMAVVPEELFPGRRSISVEELYPYTYIATEESNLDKYFNRSSFREIIELRSSDHGTALSMVAERIGVSVLPALAINQKLRGIKAVSLAPRISRTIGFAYKGGSYAVDSFVKYLKAAFECK